MNTCSTCGTPLALVSPSAWGCPVCARIFATPEPQEPTAPEPPPRVQGKVIGFRCWTLDGYRLLSANNYLGAHWTIGPNEAQCLAHRLYALTLSPGLPSVYPPPQQHDAPHPRCDCGLYAWHDASMCRNISTSDRLVFGAVQAWGRIECHLDGFRAQYAQPVLLAFHPRQPYEDVLRARAIASEMGVPFVEVSELEERAREFGSPIARELRPAAALPEMGLWGGYLSGGVVPPGPTTGGSVRSSVWSVFITPLPPRRKPP